jgi:hypothetical protein
MESANWHAFSSVLSTDRQAVSSWDVFVAESKGTLFERIADTGCSRRQRIASEGAPQDPPTICTCHCQPGSDSLGFSGKLHPLNFERRSELLNMEATHVCIGLLFCSNIISSNSVQNHRSSILPASATWCRFYQPARPVQIVQKPVNYHHYEEPIKYHHPREPINHHLSKRSTASRSSEGSSTGSNSTSLHSHLIIRKPSNHHLQVGPLLRTNQKLRHGLGSLPLT